MNDRTVTLKRGTDWVQLRLLDGGQAEVVDGTTLCPRDQVSHPEGLTWMEATKVNRNGDTVLSPFDLDLYYDSITDWFCLGEQGEDLRAAARVEEPRAQGIFELVDRVVDDNDDMAERILVALHEPERDNGERRRWTDLAA